MEDLGELLRDRRRWREVGRSAMAVSMQMQQPSVTESPPKHCTELPLERGGGWGCGVEGRPAEFNTEHHWCLRRRARRHRKASADRDA